MARARPRARIAAVAAAAWLAGAGATPASAQCAMCRRALATPEGQRMVGAFQRGIVVLLVAPFGLFGAVATLAVRRQRRRAGAPTSSDA